MKVEIRVPKELLRTIKDPFLENTRIVHAYPRVIDLVDDIPLTPDPRQPKEKSLIWKKIERSVKTNDGRFHLLNRGITISAYDSLYEPQTERLTLLLSDGNDSTSFGVIDGGHTYRTVISVMECLRAAVQEAVNADLPLENQHVHLEVLVGVQTHLADIAEARNSSVSLKPWTLAGYREKFDWFLEAIGEDYRQYVKISENDEQPVGILDLIQVMCAINPQLFPNGEPATEAYKNAGKCLVYFTEDGDKRGFRKLAAVSRDIIRLYDHIRYTWKQAYNEEDESGKHGRLAARREMDTRKRNRVALATYYFLDPANGPIKGRGENGNEEFPVEKAFAIPAISSLRPLLAIGDDGMYGWLTDPFKFWDDHGTLLVRKIMAKSNGVNAQAVGRDAELYSTLYTIVRNILLERRNIFLEKLVAEHGQQSPL